MTRTGFDLRKRRDRMAVMSQALRCHICDQAPQWQLNRRGSAVVSWSCDGHLALVCHHLQRGERAELVVTEVRVPAVTA